MPNAKRKSCPSTVKIGVEEWTIVQHNVKGDPLLTEGNYGYTQDPRNIIVIDEDLHESKKRVTVFHELLHAARMVFQTDEPKKGAEYEELEHHFIAVWEHSLLLILRDNPELTEWLLDENR
jgi:Zn-dependent peptidase ImmA (M78 family)